MIKFILKHLAWYAFLTLFSLTAVLLAFSSGAGVIFAFVLAALVALMQLAWLALLELRRSKDFHEAQLELTAQLLELQFNQHPVLAAVGGLGTEKFSVGQAHD